MRALRRLSIYLVCGVAACVLLAGCAVNRQTLSDAQLGELKQRYLVAARNDTRHANEHMLARIRHEEDEYLAKVSAGEPGERPTFDVLILSGGGDYGAFGAGILKGWGTIADAEYRRPVFDMVTGVSTGALIAPFAFVGDDPSYERLVDLYSSPKADWFTTRGLLFFLPGNESFMDNKGLRRDLEAAVDHDLVCKMARASREHRVLGINTTNLDVGAMHPFSLGAEAERAADSGDCSRLHNILLASAAIPAVFPPVIIDGALYVDGGTTSNILYGSNWLSPKAPLAMWRGAYPNEPLPRLRFWVIINNQIGTGASIVQPTWMSITKASLATTIRSGTTIAMRHLATQVDLLNREGVQTEFRYVAIPSDWRPPNEEPFNKDVMKSLADLGLKMGADPASWRQDFVD